MQSKSKEKVYITPGHEKKIKRKEEIGELLEFYSGLLTKKELGVLELYIQPSCSGAEVARKLRISRQAVHDHIRRSLGRMRRCESKLQLIANYKKNVVMFRKIMSKLDQCCAQSHNMEGERTLEELKTLFEKLINRNSHEL
ncbi:hypothetical protein [Candidatus Cryosericum septentrionale]|jgi:predicted DNA-binding protein YlxM (UPF0122 family)|uniref:Uncharacterized protein n=1 Tax=Candidatus Cryosericum septentrionale TaxID=2290913 RepID=A0A398DTB4_9BACT|nr:hypothetical protein [Candidatus Cryosericum septentrionale]RIE17309.1 hypothetical protein SMC1_02415 [Candidatus Cryosericum septentrionale]